MSGVLVLLVIAVVYFLILYFIAFMSNRHYRDSSDILWITGDQWWAILIMWAPILLVFFLEYEGQNGLIPNDSN